MMPGAMNANAGMSDQEQQMIKAVCDTPNRPTKLEMAAIAVQHCFTNDEELDTDKTYRCKWVWNLVSAKPSWPV
jgi:hypothetical protein